MLNGNLEFRSDGEPSFKGGKLKAYQRSSLSHFRICSQDEIEWMLSLSIFRSMANRRLTQPM